MIRKSGYRFSEKICSNKKIERDDDSKKSHPGLVEFHEKNAIFSAWLRRRIGASGSGPDTLGFRRIPLAIRVEPNKGSGEGSGEASREA
jgi:hypothetical protein